LLIFLPCACEGVAGTGIAADGVGCRRSTDGGAGVWQPRAADDAKHLTAWRCETQHSSISSYGIATGAAADSTAASFDIDATDSSKDYDKFNDADAVVCAGTAAVAAAGQCQQTAVDGAASKQRD